MSKDEDKIDAMYTGGSRGACPVFSGKAEDYEHWRVQAEDWLLLGEARLKYPGIELRVALRSKALEATCDIDRKELCSDKGVELIFAQLDKLYRKDKVLEEYGALRNYLRIEKTGTESMKEYINRYEKVADKCKKMTGTELSGKMKGCHLLEMANLKETDKKLVISACGIEEIKYDVVAKVLCRTFEGIDQVEESKDWFGAEARGASNRGEYGGQRGWRGKRTNPRGRGGWITRCVLCRSQYHWVKECPQNFENKEKTNLYDKKVEEKQTREEEPSTKAETSTVYMSTVEGIEDPWGSVEGVLDTGCNSSVCGEL